MPFDMEQEEYEEELREKEREIYTYIDHTYIHTYICIDIHRFRGDPHLNYIHMYHQLQL